MEPAVNQVLPPVCAFMDDLTLLNPSTKDSQCILTKLITLMEWARMKFKPKKSRSLVLSSGKLNEEFHFYMYDEPIPSVSEQPVKSLGRWYTKDLKDTSIVRDVKSQLSNGLQMIDRCGLPGKFKLWCLKYGLYPWIMWPLMMYEVAITHVEEMERWISTYIRKWLGVPRSLSNIAFYGHSTMLHLPLTSLIEEFKVTKAHLYMTLRDSEDQVVKDTLPEVRTGVKWSAKEEVESMESRLCHKDIVGATQIGRAGLGMQKHSFFYRASDHERRRMVTEEIRVGQEEACQAKAAGLVQQGQWTQWETLEARSLSWNELWCMEPLMIKFLIRSTYSVLPCPTNLKVWNLADDDKCTWCHERGTAEHILNGCSVPLAGGMYKWRHDQVLLEIGSGVEHAVKQANKVLTSSSAMKFIPFVPEGGDVYTSTAKSLQGVLSTTDDWVLHLDLDNQLLFPQEIAQTDLRPDLVIWSKHENTVIIGELTVPWEDNVEVAHEYKYNKYTDLVLECREKGWKVILCPFEVGSRGFIAQSLVKFLSKIGVSAKDRKKLQLKASEAACRGSAWIWKKYQMAAQTSK